VPGARSRFLVTLSEASDRLMLTFFNGGYLRGRIVPGMVLRVRGKMQWFNGGRQMANPKWEEVDEQTERIANKNYRPVYPVTSGLESERLGHLIAAHLDSAAAEILEWFPTPLLQKRRLIGRAQAYRRIHCPATPAEAAAARRRLVYDELMLMQLGLGLAKRWRDAQVSAPLLKSDRLLDERIRRRFPFALTDAQERAVWQILTDLKSGKPMSRLLQGDVGSGKTVVALYAMLVAVANKMQAALLVPTEVLAEQHYLTLGNWLAGSDVKIALVTARTRKTGREKLARQLSDGTIDIAVGTHALIQHDVEFKNLGLVVADEQHRLGVRQRGTLTAKGTAAHSLIMTATPIPRTLALSYLADFDLTVIDRLPPGRQPIKTRWVRPDRAAEAYEFICAQVAQGRQAYVVVPHVEDNGLDDAKSVRRELARLSAGPLSHLRLAAMHGQLPTHRKQATMQAFRDGHIDVLVATTVIEVGIDVPNATVMLIDNAERFGLSQLHQLRGRVGRGGAESHCILLADAGNAIAEARLNALVEHSSGFEIAELDLQLRGPGEFFGTRQHGLPEFKLADIRGEIDLLIDAKEDAQELLARDPQLASPPHRHLRSALMTEFGDSIGLARIG